MKKQSSNKLSKAQCRRIPQLAQLYKMIYKYNLREEAYATTLEEYIHLKKKK